VDVAEKINLSTITYNQSTAKLIKNVPKSTWKLTN